MGFWLIIIIIVCALALGIRNPWKWFKESSMRSQRKADERADADELKRE
jgi:hypothetical protein